MKKYKELYNLDPTFHLDVQLSAEEDNDVHTQSLFHALRSDLFTFKLQQIAWDTFCQKWR
jgi:hypothetical protein